MEYRRTYRTHRSFVPLAIGYIEKKSNTLEKIVSFMALKKTIEKINPEAVCEKEHDIFLQERIEGITDIDGFYSYFLKKGLSQSEVTHRLKRIKFLKLINDSIYIIPPLHVYDLPVDDKLTEIEIHDPPLIPPNPPILQIVDVPTKPVEELRMPVLITTSMAQAITELTKVLNHSGFKEVKRDSNGRKFSGFGHSIILKALPNEAFDLSIIEDDSPNGEIIPYKKNKSGNYMHITGHTFSAINYLMKRSHFGFSKGRSSEFTRVYNRADYTVFLKWKGETTEIEFSRHLVNSTHIVTERYENMLTKEEQKFLNRNS